jgi:hypothetical protein
MWWRFLGVDVAVGAVLVAAWYLIFLRLNRKRGGRILQWIEQALEGKGLIDGAKWLSASRLQVRLRLFDSGFCQPSMLVQLLPRETPLQWVASLLKRRRETLTFESNLPYAPNFNLEVHNHRWCGRSRRKLVPDKNWTLSRMGPFVITSRPDWQRDIQTMVESTVASRDCNFMQVKFGRSTPHFSATIPLTTLQPDSNLETGVFDALKDLASGASASRF